MSQVVSVTWSFVRNRVGLGGDLCLEMGSGITGNRVGVEGLGSLLGLALVRKSATDALVCKDKVDMTEEMSRTTMGSLLCVLSTGLGAARTFRLESFKGRKGLGPPMSNFGCLHMSLAVLKATGCCLFDDAGSWSTPMFTRSVLGDPQKIRRISDLQESTSFSRGS